MRVTITGIQQAQKANLYNIAQLQPSGALGRAVQHASTMAERYAASITHVDTGALRASHRIELKGLHGTIYLDPTARNPRSGALTSRYGPVEHARGGSHAFYYRTVNEAGMSIAREAARAFVEGLR